MPTSLYPRLATGIALMLLAVASDDDPSVPGVQINPTGDSSQNWLHWITY